MNRPGKNGGYGLEQSRTEPPYLKQIEKRIDLALQSAEVGLWELNTLNGTIWRSPSFDQIFGAITSPSEWTLDCLLNHVVPADRAKVKEAFGSAMRTSHLSTECRIIKPDRSEGWVSVRAQAFKDSHGVTNRLTGVIIDISHLKSESEEHKRVAQEMKTREDFLSNACYDMRNHVTAGNRLLEYFVTGVLRHYLDDEHQELLKWLMQSNFNVRQLTNNLIDVYRWERNTTCFLFADIDLQSVITSTIKQMNLLAYLHGVSIVADLPRESIVIKGSAKEFQRVLLNLLDNALTSSPSNSSITVRLFQLVGCALLEVEDNGPAITQTEDLFKRSSPGRIGTPFSSGSGIGLYLCKKIVEAHNGTIKCKSETDGPTIFQVYLPVSKIHA